MPSLDGLTEEAKVKDLYQKLGRYSLQLMADNFKSTMILE
jgi:hypothetical protein